MHSDAAAEAMKLDGVRPETLVNLVSVSASLSARPDSHRYKIRAA